jgi:hypothetical protein
MTVTHIAACAIAALVLTCASPCDAQTPSPAGPSTGSTSTDVFVMLGSDFVRPGSPMKGNYNIGLGHTFEWLKHDPLGDEVTFAYTYENAGDNFWHSTLSSSTETVGVMKNFALFDARRLTWYTWIQIGVTSFAGGSTIQNRFYNGESLGAILHVTAKESIWIQETYNKVATAPWYTTTSFGYTWSW